MAERTETTWLSVRLARKDARALDELNSRFPLARSTLARLLLRRGLADVARDGVAALETPQDQQTGAAA